MNNIDILKSYYFYTNVTGREKDIFQKVKVFFLPFKADQEAGNPSFWQMIHTISKKALILVDDVPLYMPVTGLGHKEDQIEGWDSLGFCKSRENQEEKMRKIYLFLDRVSEVILQGDMEKIRSNPDVSWFLEKWANNQDKETQLNELSSLAKQDNGQIKIWLSERIKEIEKKIFSYKKKKEKRFMLTRQEHLVWAITRAIKKEKKVIVCARSHFFTAFNAEEFAQHKVLQTLRWEPSLIIADGPRFFSIESNYFLWVCQSGNQYPNFQFAIAGTPSLQLSSKKVDKLVKVVENFNLKEKEKKQRSIPEKISSLVGTILGRKQDFINEKEMILDCSDPSSPQWIKKTDLGRKQDFINEKEMILDCSDPSPPQWIKKTEEEGFIPHSHVKREGYKLERFEPVLSTIEEEPTSQQITNETEI